MALMRVYCGLAAGEPTGAQQDDRWLTVAVVDDAGRLLDVCDIADDAVGYAELGALLAERSAGGGGVAVAADTDEHHVTLLLAAAGRPLAIVDEELLVDYAERFADDESPDEMEAGPAERAAVGLARALQAGALDASSQAAPRELMALKPVLAAHAAVATGRHSTAVALREVLRELYPAALRAYPDPAEPIPLAILDALPEPGLLGSTAAARNRDNTVVAELSTAGVADAGTISDAVAALRVAIAETPRRTGIGKGTTTAVAATIREAVAAVRACDNAINALVGLLTEKGAATAATPAAPARTGASTVTPISQAARTASESPRTAAVRRTRPTTVQADTEGAAVIPVPALRPARNPTSRTAGVRPSPRPATAPAERPVAVADAATAPPPPPGIKPFYPADPDRAETAPTRPQRPVAALERPAAAPAAVQQRPAAPGQAAPGQAATSQAAPRRAAFGPNGPSPVTPSQPAQAPALPPTAAVPEMPVWSMEPAGGYAPIPGGGTFAYEEAPAATFRPDEFTEGDLPPAYPLSTEIGAPGSRERWPVNPPSMDDEAVYARVNPAYTDPAIPRQREARVAPPWQADDLPPEPSLPIVDEPAMPPLRLVGPDEGRSAYPAEPRRAPYVADPRSIPIDEDDNDGDLLIFAQARSSAWFDWPSDPEPERPTWSEIDAGWSAAARVENPETDGTTDVGLPRRVPQANLVPGAPLPPAAQPSLRIVRDPAAMAAHTTGYFRGSRRGEEVRGYAVGGRPGRESGGGWDFSRDGWDTDTGYRSAANR